MGEFICSVETFPVRQIVIFIIVLQHSSLLFVEVQSGERQEFSLGLLSLYCIVIRLSSAIFTSINYFNPITKKLYRHMKNFCRLLRTYILVWTGPTKRLQTYPRGMSFCKGYQILGRLLLAVKIDQFYLSGRSDVNLIKRQNVYF